MSYKDLLEFYLIFSVFIFATAGQESMVCPEVSGTKFNCTEVIQNLRENENEDQEIDLLIYGFLPPSKESVLLNVFGFDFKKDDISDYYAQLICNDHLQQKNILRINCGVNFPFERLNP